MPGHTGGHQASGYGPTGSGRSRGPQDHAGPSPSVTGLVDKDKNPVTFGDEGEQVGFGAGLLSKNTPFSNAALEAALADVNSPSFGAAQAALGMNPDLAQNAAIQAAIVNNPALTQTAVQMGLKEDPNKPAPTLASIQNRIDALKRSPFSTLPTPNLISLLSMNPTLAPNLSLTQAFAEATDDDTDTESPGLGLSLGEALAQDFSNISSAVYGTVTNPIGTMESALQSPVGQYASFSLPSLSPTMVALSIINQRPRFNEQGETIGTGFLGPLGVSMFGKYDSDNYSIDDESRRAEFTKDFYGSAPGQGLFSPDPDSVEGYSVDADAMRDVVAEYGGTYIGPDIGAMAREAQEGTRGRPAEVYTTDTDTDSGAGQEGSDPIGVDYQAIYDEFSADQKATADKIEAMDGYDFAYAVNYVRLGGPLF